MPKIFFEMFKKKYPNIKYLLPPLMKSPLYTFVSKKHTDLAPKLAAALDELRANGRMQAIADEVEADIK